MTNNLLFPFPSAVELDGKNYDYQAVLERLAPMLTEARLKRLQQVASSRDFSVVTVLENIYDRGNATAVMRTAEGLGFPEIHMIEKGERFKAANRVAQGADKWTEVTRWKETGECLSSLKKRGYQIWATHLDENSQSLDDIDLNVPVAIVLGNEKEGISPDVLKHCDRTVIIPMSGFVQSFNISVAGALCLQRFRLARNRTPQAHLSEEEKQIILAHYITRSFDNPGQLMKRS